MYQLDKLRKHRRKIYNIAQKHFASRIYIFGSCVRHEETKKSDVDFLVDFLPEASLLDLIRLQDDLQSYLKRPVDVISRDGIHPFLKDEILKEAIEL
ncbi:MAG: Nucleotidyltransferase domain protein [Lentisphaerae bacterium ADurb.Bin242]|nr:MAG: Nucleotidyltransferase domain protein [Lentisphaerae bacterium ADurb.Bin242]